ncbi:MAG: 50S ribosomal protein L24 [Puniceicoccales bacterium]|nr:50S ribosomal protein L24 [Puniceicoccales bacterium]
MKCGMKVGDEVLVLCGDDRGKQGKVLKILDAGSRVLVEGVRVQKKHVKKTAKYPEGAVLEREAPISRSNLRKILGDGVKRD